MAMPVMLLQRGFYARPGILIAMQPPLQITNEERCSVLRDGPRVPGKTLHLLATQKEL
jgi:hypothetical protein